MPSPLVQLREPVRVAIKALSAVEASRERSHQHELNGSSALKQVLGPEKWLDRETSWVFLADDQEPRLETHSCSWYDARENHPTRTEWRLYYRGQLDLQEGDLLLIVTRDVEPSLLFVVARKGSSWFEQLLAIFGPLSSNATAFRVDEVGAFNVVYRRVLEDLFETAGWLGYESEGSSIELEQLLAEFPEGFPKSKRFSEYARDRFVEDHEADYDGLLLGWFQKEESLFRLLEQHELANRLRQVPPFSGVDDFLSFSLSVQNRRKSRAGHALENHFEALLVRERLAYSRGAATEGGRKPDFIMPGVTQYHDPAFPTERLTILAAKTTCKDRWRQVLNEAARVRVKHLLTLEPSISQAQLTEMHDEGVVLIAPREIAATYSPPPGMRVLTVSEFMEQLGSRVR